MPGPGYGQGLFNPDGPKNFAAAIGTIKAPLSDVVKGFQDMGTASKQSLQEISDLLDQMSQKANTFTSALRGGTTGGGGGGGTTGGGGAAPQWGSIPTANTGQTGGTQGSTPGWGGTVGGSNNQPADQSARQTTAPNAGQPATMAQRAAVALPGAVAGAAQGYIAQQMPAAMQAAVVSQQFAAQYGVSARQYQTVPRNAPGGGPQLTFSQQDWQSTQWEIANRLSAAPGSQRYRQALQQNNMLMKLLPGIQSSDAAQEQTDMFSTQSINQFLGIGMNIRPGGREMPQQQIFQQLGRMAGGGRDLTERQVIAGFQSGGQLESLGRRFLGGPGDPRYEAWANQLRTVSHYQATHPNATAAQINQMLANDKGQRQLNLDSAYTSQLKKQSAATSLQSQTTPGIISASKVMNDAATKFYQAVNTFVGGTGAGRAGAFGVGAGMTALSNPILGTLASVVPGLFGGGGGAGGGGAGIGAGSGGTGAGLTGLMAGGGGGGSMGAFLPAAIGAAGVGGLGMFGLGTLGMTAFSNLGPAKDAGSALHSVGSAIIKNLDSWGKSSVKAMQDVGKTLGTAFTSLLKGLGGLGSGIGGLFSKAVHGIGGLFSSITHGVGSLFSTPSASAAPAAGSPQDVNAKQAWSASFGSPTSSPTSLLGRFQKPGTSSSGGGSSGGTGGSGGTTSLSGSGNVQQAYNFFIAKGLADYQAAGIVGNLAQESGVNPKSTSPGALGIAQWTPPTNLNNWAKSQNRNNTDLSTQLDFLWQDMPKQGALSAVQGAKDAASAAQAFEQTYERAGIPMMQNRIKYAQNILASKGANFARGTYNVTTTQLALLHAGERVIPAADNFSMGGRYERLGSTAAGVTVHMHFKPNAIQLVVPPNATANDMDTIAKQFVSSLSKPQVLAGIRTS